jgi:hypothetical protein
MNSELCRRAKASPIHRGRGHGRPRGSIKTFCIVKVRRSFHQRARKGVPGNTPLWSESMTLRLQAKLMENLTKVTFRSVSVCTSLSVHSRLEVC